MKKPRKQKTDGRSAAQIKDDLRSQRRVVKSPPRQYVDIHRVNARLAFNDLILSLTSPIHNWTTSERYDFNRVLKFLED